MPTVKTNKIDASLQKKGFDKTNRDHNYYILYVEGKKTKIHTKISHSATEIDDFLVKQMARQVRLDRKQFEDLIECPLSKEDYIEILKEKGEVVP